MVGVVARTVFFGVPSHAKKTTDTRKKKHTHIRCLQARCHMAVLSPEAQSPWRSLPLVLPRSVRLLSLRTSGPLPSVSPSSLASPLNLLTVPLQLLLPIFSLLRKLVVYVQLLQWFPFLFLSFGMRLHLSTCVARAFLACCRNYFLPISLEHLAAASFQNNFRGTFVGLHSLSFLAVCSILNAFPDCLQVLRVLPDSSHHHDLVEISILLVVSRLSSAHLFLVRLTVHQPPSFSSFRIAYTVTWSRAPHIFCRYVYHRYWSSTLTYSPLVRVFPSGPTASTCRPSLPDLHCLIKWTSSCDQILISSHHINFLKPPGSAS